MPSRKSLQKTQKKLADSAKVIAHITHCISMSHALSDGQTNTNGIVADVKIRLHTLHISAPSALSNGYAGINGIIVGVGALCFPAPAVCVYVHEEVIS